MAFSGTFVAAGTGAGIAVATGSATELGRISELVGSVKTLTTPLLRQIAQLAEARRAAGRHGSTRPQPRRGS